MTDLAGPHLRHLERRARRAALKAGPVVSIAARLGYLARGFVYLLVGALACLAAFHFRAGRTADTTSALADVLAHPFGWALLVLIAAGLLGYALWCLVLAFADPDQRGHDVVGLLKRLGTLANAFVYLAFAALVAGMAAGLVQQRPGHDPVSIWTARAFAYPFGRLVVAIIALSTAGTGLFQLFRSWHARPLHDQLDLHRLSPGLRTWTLRLCRFGVAARGAVFALIGFYLLLAAAHADPHLAKGLGRSLHALQGEPKGRWLLALAASGLVAYGLFQFILSAFRRIEPA